MTHRTSARRSSSVPSGSDRVARDVPPTVRSPSWTLRTELLAGLIGALVTPDGDAEVRSFFDISPVPQLLLTPDRKVRVANRAAGRLFAPSGASLGGRPFADLLAPSARAALEGLFRALDGPAASGQRVASEALSADGRAVPIELLIVRLAAGAASGFGIVARDLRVPAAGRVPAPLEVGGTYTLAELLMADRLRELV